MAGRRFLISGEAVGVAAVIGVSCYAPAPGAAETFEVTHSDAERRNRRPCV